MALEQEIMGYYASGLAALAGTKSIGTMSQETLSVLRQPFEPSPQVRSLRHSARFARLATGF